MTLVVIAIAMHAASPMVFIARVYARIERLEHEWD
jgi:hypothetical protein